MIKSLPIKEISNACNNDAPPPPPFLTVRHEKLVDALLHEAVRAAANVSHVEEEASELGPVRHRDVAPVRPRLNVFQCRLLNCKH